MPASILSTIILLGAVVLAAAGASMVSTLVDAATGGGGLAEHIPDSWPGSGTSTTGGGPGLTELGVMLSMQALMVVFTIAAASAGRGRADETLALRPAFGGGRAYILAFAGLLAGLLAFNILTSFVRPDDWMRDLEQYQSLVLSDRWWIFALVVVIGAPLSEELLFRGFLLPALAQSPIGYLGGAILTSAAWAGLHWGYSATSLIEIFLIGLYLCAVLWRTGSLWVTIVCHSTYNLALLVVMWSFGSGGA